MAEPGNNPILYIPQMMENQIVKENEDQNNIDISNLTNMSSSMLTLEIKFENETISSSGFLAQMKLPNLNKTLRGIIANAHILKDQNLLNSEITINIILSEKKLYLKPNTHFCFVDPFLDLIFIEIQTPEFDDLMYLELQNEGQIHSNIILIKSPKDKKPSYEKGKIDSRWGFELKCKISSESEYNGCGPIISTTNNKFVGISKSYKSLVNHFDIGLNSIEVIKAIENKYITYNEDKVNYIEVKELMDLEINELDEHGLKETSSPFIFISPPSLFITPIWFYRTNHAWYWTPTEPKNNNASVSNWMIIYPNCSKKVIGGMYNNIEPAAKNIKIIDYLSNTGKKFL